MAITNTKTIYEVLFRFDEFGTFKGAHTKHIETVQDTTSGVVFSARETPPVAVSSGDVSALMDQTLGDLAGQVVELTIERDALIAAAASIANG